MTNFQKIIRSKLLLTLAAVLIVYALSGFFLAPYLVTRFVPGMAEEKLNRELRLGAVKINPFLFRFQADDVGLYEPDGSLIAGFDRCFFDFELSSLFQWALVFKSLRLDGPRVNLIFDEAGVLNITRLVPETPETSDPESALDGQKADPGPPRLVFNHIQIVAGEINLADQRQSVPAIITIHPLGIELHDISTLPDREGPYSLAAVTQEQESFEWTGQIALNPFSASGHLDFSHIKLSTVWQFFRDRTRLDKPEGRFSLDSTYAIDFGQTEPSVQLSDLQFKLADLSLKLPNLEPPLLELSRLDIKVPLADVTHRTVAIETILFDRGRTMVAIDENGRLNWGRITAEAGGNDHPPLQNEPQPSRDKAQDTSGDDWKIQVADVTLQDIQFNYQDQSRSPVLDAGVTDIDGTFQLALLSGSAGTDLQVKGLSFGMNDIQIGNPQTPVPEIRLQTWLVKGADFDLASNTLSIDHAIFQDGNIDVRRDKDGQLNLAELFLPAGTDAEKTQASPGNTGKPAFQYLIRDVDVSNFGLAFSDQTVKTDGEIVHLDHLHVAVSHIDGRSQMPVDVSFDIREGGRVEIQSRVDPAEPSVQADMNVASIFLTPFEPYLASQAMLQLASGTLSTRGQFAFREKEMQPKIAYNGDLDVADLQILEIGSDKTFLGWEHLIASDLKLRLQPNRLEIEDLKLAGLDGQFIIFEDGSLNLTNVFRERPREPDKNEAPVAAKTEGPVFPIYLHKLRVENGGLFFADYSLMPHFATGIHQLDGSIIGMSSERNARAQVQLDGRVDDYGTSEIKGEINIFDPTAYTDMSLLFRNLEMTRLTPYSGKFVGRRIDSGRLALDLTYSIDNGKLMGNNQIVIERIELGEKIDSPDAVSLPLNLAIAILEDANGVIDIGLPVTGDLADPKFSYGQLVWKAFTNLITRLASAPFRALGALLGGASETLDAIFFKDGSAELLPPEVEKLVNLSQALEKRPNLKLVVQGRYSVEKDGKAKKNLQVRRRIAERQGLILSSGEDPGILDFGNPDIQLALEAVFTERFGTGTLDEIKATLAQPTAEEAGQVDPSEKEVKIQEPAALWKMLFAKMLTEESLAETVLIQLAEARAQAIIQELHGTRGFSLERIAVKQPEALKPGTPVQADLALEVLQ